MIISRQRRFVVFQPWKTASQTLALRLRNFDESPYSASFGFNEHLNRVVHHHLTCADFAALPESRLGYFLASFVRNPYDRVYAGFRQLSVDMREQPALAFAEPWVRDLVLRQLDENQVQLEAANYDFDAWVALLREAQIYEAGRNTSFPLHPAHYWTHLAGRQYVSFIGRVEQFEGDFTRLTELLGLGDLGRANANVVELAGPTGASCSRYADRMHKRSIDKITALFDADFERFGYDRIGSAAAVAGHA